MVKFYKRNFFTHINQYQKTLLYSVLVPCFVGCVIILLCLDYLYYDYTAFLNRYEYRHYKSVILFLLPVLSLILFGVSLAMFYASNKIVGPYDRIVREMDEMLEKGERKALGVRKGDTMFEELLKRVNKLIGR
ncbi:MAG TPA: hypothetical protein P5246_00985 [Candidatus Omnitrophota bacterium]|nr:hypothetical protein [Candidatus Omnitrophota bacterium]HSA31539.1 hypothetical protein [Candidatus Omnitrophota bacterium]